MQVGLLEGLLKLEDLLGMGKQVDMEWKVFLFGKGVPCSPMPKFSTKIMTRPK